MTLARHCQDAGRPFFVLRLAGFADAELRRLPGDDVGVAELGKGIRALKQAGCRAVCMAGVVNRPDFSQLKPDLRGLAAVTCLAATSSKCI